MQTELHTPLRGATPTQIESARKKRERDERFALAAERLAQSKLMVIAPLAPEPPAPVCPDAAIAEWVERQRLLALTPTKATWFHIIDEVRTGPRRHKIEEIQRSTAEEFGCTRDDIICARRTADIVLPRQVAVYLCKMLTLKSFPEIGRMFGGRDHTTALSSFRKIERLLTTDSDLQATIERIKQKLGVEQ